VDDISDIYTDGARAAGRRAQMRTPPKAPRAASWGGAARPICGGADVDTPVVDIYHIVF